MLIGARTAAWNGCAAKPTASDYVQDGLIGLFDGIENVGFNLEHDDSATTWVNCVDATKPFVFESSGWDWTGDGLVLPTGKYQVLCESQINNSSIKHIEICAQESERLVSCPVVLQVWKKSIWLYSASNGGIATIASRSSVYASPNLQNLRGTVSVGYNSETAGDQTVRYNDVDLNYGGYADSWSANRLTLVIGYVYNSNWSFHGTINCIRAYNRVLSGEEMSDNYAVDQARFKLT